MAFGGGTFAISQQAHTCGRAMPFLPMARQLRTCCAANQMLQSHRSAPLLTAPKQRRVRASRSLVVRPVAGESQRSNQALKKKESGPPGLPP
eukprot:CAMPEP_0206147164 /NCGR_PEP_ID=MMETSP1473-20131121/32605_1 /ASSEMBLY_ACC=CAM_ASM_001109 /TAXON_ID=1461547 /ORGANISM="Stichococcus sp, Strain RCC1054" /LENGTH=91 /DNA_ID=CAMNT_0053543997 /DNA_START=225 /DNA_END=496 /DNA_ORIENTATION=+